MTQDNTG